jgi:hypothetical protein
MITIKLHRTGYTPIIPHAETVRTYGAIKSKAIIIFWLWWVMNIEVNPHA